MKGRINAFFVASSVGRLSLSFSIRSGICLIESLKSIYKIVTWASLVGQEASPNARNLNKETPTQNAGVSLLSLRFLLKLAISLTSNNSKRYVTNICVKGS